MLCYLKGRRITVAALLVPLVVGCFNTEPLDVSDYPEMPDLAGQCVEIASPMLLVRQTASVVESEELTRFLLVRPGEPFAPFTLEEYTNGVFEPSGLAEVVDVVEVGTRIHLDRIWSLRSFEGSIPALTAVLEIAGKQRTVNVLSILDDDWQLALDKGELHELERREVAGRQVLDARFARPCSGSAVSESP